MSINDLLACGFAKIFCYNTFIIKSTLKKDPSETLTCYKSRLVHHQHHAFLSTFSLCLESATYNQFQENLKNIVGNIQKANITKKANRQNAPFEEEAYYGDIFFRQLGRSKG